MTKEDIIDNNNNNNEIGEESFNKEDIDADWVGEEKATTTTTTTNKKKSTSTTSTSNATTPKSKSPNSLTKKTTSDTHKRKISDLENDKEENPEDSKPKSNSWTNGQNKSHQMHQQSHTTPHQHQTKVNNNSGEKPVCKYGESCYRKNPQHLAEYAHPPKKHFSLTLPTGIEPIEEEDEKSSSQQNNTVIPLSQKPQQQQQVVKQEQQKKYTNDGQPPAKQQKVWDFGELADSNYTIRWNELEMGEVVGQGAFGAVRKATFKGTMVAIKILFQAKSDDKMIAMFRGEAEMLVKMRHPNVVACLGVVLPKSNDSHNHSNDNSNTSTTSQGMPNGSNNGMMIYNSFGGSHSLADFCLVLEYMPTDLKRYINETGGLGKNLYKTVMIQICQGIVQGLTYLHESKPKIIHRDLKPANILLSSTLQPKLADFGISREKEETSTMTRIGTPMYMAPEILQAHKYNELVDIYSFGMVLYQMTTGKIPFATEAGLELNPLQVIMKASIEKQRPTLPDFVPSSIANIIKLCWEHEAQRRPTSSFLVNFFNKIQL